MTALSSGKIISNESYLEMTTDYSPENSHKYGYGMAGYYNGGWGHSGFIGNYTSFDYINDGYHLFIAATQDIWILKIFRQICLPM